MKTKYIISIFIIGCISMLVGSMFKIMHWPYTSQLIITGTALQVLGALLTIGKIFTSDKFKDFLNS